jgi:hypothetical protein
MRLKNNAEEKEAMKSKKSITAVSEIALSIILILWSCRKDYTSIQDNAGFILSSTEIGADSLLPVDYTCDGAAATLPLRWTGAPSNTFCFALIMHHEASPPIFTGIGLCIIFLPVLLLSQGI